MWSVVSEVLHSLSWLDWILLMFASLWLWDHGFGAGFTSMKGWFASGKTAVSDVVARVEKLEAEVFGAAHAAVPPTLPASTAASLAALQQASQASKVS